MAKMTIYVPDDLKAEMDAAEDQQVNWSSIAQDAFAFMCERIKNRRKGASKMNAVIERLRASKEKVENQMKQRGLAAGRKWAMDAAEYDELKRVSALWETAVDDEMWLLEVAQAIEDDGTIPDAADVARFWSELCGEDFPDAVFVAAFAEGASEVFEEVKDEL